MYQLPALESADHGLGERIIQALKSLDNSPLANTALPRDRDLDDWVVRMPEGEDIKSVVRKLTKAGKKKGLPVVLYSRSRGLNTLSPDQAVNVKGVVPFAELGQLSSAKVDVSWFELSYSIITLAQSREEAEALMLMWYFHVSRKRANHHKINMNYLVGGTEYSLQAFITDPTTLLASDFSFPDERLYGLRQDITIQAPLLYGKEVDIPQSVRIGFDIKAVD